MMTRNMMYFKLIIINVETPALLSALYMKTNWMSLKIKLNLLVKQENKMIDIASSLFKIDQDMHDESLLSI